MTALGDYILKGADIGAEMGDSHTRTFINHLKSVTGYLLDPAIPINLEDYINEVNQLRKPT